MTEKWVIILTNAKTGAVAVYGPFDSYKLALGWYSRNLGIDEEINISVMFPSGETI